VDNFFLSALVREISPEVSGRAVARVSLAGSTLLFDLRLNDERRLLISLDRANPALYLSTQARNRSATERERELAFLSLLRKHIGDARLARISKEPGDRIIELDFERSDAIGNPIATKLVVMLTGRSANAGLFDAEGLKLRQFFKQGDMQVISSAGQAHADSDPADLLSDLNSSITQAEVLERISNANIFAPQLKNEFLARCRERSPADALRSLIDDLTTSKPAPLVYSRLPLDEIGERVVTPNADLLLTHIELTQARGMYRYQFESLSEAADEYYAARQAAADLLNKYSAAKQELAREIARRQNAIKAIESDRARFETPERLKRFGDLILASLATARTHDSKVVVVDYYDQEQREIEIDVPEGATLQEAASSYFARYQKARRALEALASRERIVSSNLNPLKQLLRRLEREPTRSCTDEVTVQTDQLLGRSFNRRSEKKKSGGKDSTFGRRFRSSDGYEIVVGRNDKENDALTFRVARPFDVWLHAADYPGSHVVIRNPTRQPAPHRTIIEAAELAAFYSQAKRGGKAAVHYTQRKFVSKPPRSKPGLVRLSSFKTVMVEPRSSAERMES
jgi:predicted ribosome quality control (RQC) complex YloA/Tae2 family protein